MRLRTTVEEVREDAVVVKRPDGEHETIPCASVIWASGVSANTRIGDWEPPKGKGGRVETNPDLSVVGYPYIFAVGDVGIGHDDPLPHLAQPAIQGGKHAGVQIRRTLAGSPTQKFTYHDKGIMATIGRNDAVVQFPFGATLKGPLAWLSWLALHIVYLIGNRNRFSTLINLAARYLGGRAAA
ncbi:hypothetical protein GCM10025868_24120 [Angustibacter aerolatus]|uniref:FAD/NAD(P)-binding domain-containing protein n=1 Tax=Angustibacter aerolatus TaxID=1162965 RepID=A0ABQ6JG22_9ACTN|nr:hypothetical protein GCM10025868_24120 [Angustibacter aerolatus]